MRYFDKGSKEYNEQVYSHYGAPMRNHILLMKDQIEWLLGRVNNVHALPVVPDPSGECDGQICDLDMFKLTHAKMVDAAAALAVLYRTTERRIEREVARTKLQQIDGVL